MALGVVYGWPYAACYAVTLGVATATILYLNSAEQSTPTLPYFAYSHYAMPCPLFAQPPHQFDLHTHRPPQADDAHLSIYNLRLSSPDQLDAAYGWIEAHTWANVSIGIHPWDSALWHTEQVTLLTPLFALPQVVAIGECGLDRLRGGSTPATLAHQMALLRMQATLAQQHDLPLIIHCVKAQAELLLLRREFEQALWVIHGFRGSPRAAAPLWQKGIATSFGQRYIPTTLAACPPHLCYHETDESPLPFASIWADHQPFKTTAVDQ